MAKVKPITPEENISTAVKQISQVYPSALSRTPMALLPYQQRWCADTAQVKVCEKSRRIGLTWGEAADTALLASRTNGMDSWYVGYNKDMALEFIRDCANWAKFYGLAAGEIEETEEVFKDGDEDKYILAFVIRFASGWRITALSSRPSNLRGKQGRVIFDEAAFHDDIDELLKAALALLMWGGEVHIISTHNGVDNPFNELINDIRAGKRPYSLHRITFDDAIADGLYERICLRRGIDWSAQGQADWIKSIRDSYGDMASEELDCIPKNGGGKWLNRALIESRMSAYTPVIRLAKDETFGLMTEPKRRAEIDDWIEEALDPLLDELNAKQVSFFGEDFARSGDSTVLCPLLQDDNLTLKPPFMVELHNIPFKQQEQILIHTMRRLPNLRGAALDARGNGQSLAEAARDEFGGLVECVMLSEAWYRDNTAQFKAALEDGTLDGLPKNKDVLDDLRAFEMVKGVPRIPEARTKGSDGTKRHGDSGIALLLAHYASRELNQAPVKVSSRKPRESTNLTQGY